MPTSTLRRTPLRDPIPVGQIKEPVPGGRVMGPIGPGVRPMLGTITNIVRSPDRGRVTHLRVRLVNGVEMMESVGSWGAVNISSIVQIHMKPELADPWIYTDGMWRLHMPELEIRGLPAFMLVESHALLARIMGWLVGTGTVLKHGDTLHLGGFGVHRLVRFLQLPVIRGQEGHFYRTRLAFTDDPRMQGLCGLCGRIDTHVHNDDGSIGEVRPALEPVPWDMDDAAPGGGGNSVPEE